MVQRGTQTLEEVAEKIENHIARRSKFDRKSQLVTPRGSCDTTQMDTSSNKTGHQDKFKIQFNEAVLPHREALPQRNINKRKKKDTTKRVKINLQPMKNAQQHLLEKLEKMENRDEDLVYLIGSFISEKDKLDEIYMQQCNFSDEEEDDSEVESNIKLENNASPVGKTFYQNRYSQQTSPDQALGDVLEQIE